VLTTGVIEFSPFSEKRYLKSWLEKEAARVRYGLLNERFLIIDLINIFKNSTRHIQKKFEFLFTKRFSKFEKKSLFTIVSSLWIVLTESFRSSSVTVIGLAASDTSGHVPFFVIHRCFFTRFIRIIFKIMNQKYKLRF
jgi:hypothetical protein